MYVIFVKAPITPWNVQSGFYTGCYRGKTNEGPATFIGFTDRDDNWMRIKQFKTLKAAENKLKFLENKIDDNGYMWDWELSIHEITEEDMIK